MRIALFFLTMLLGGCVPPYVPVPLQPNQEATLNISAGSVLGTAYVDITPPGASGLVEKRLLMNDKPGTVATTTVSIPAAQTVRFDFGTKVYASNCIGFFKFYVAPQEVYDLGAGDIPPPKPAPGLGPMTFKLGPKNWHVCYLSLFERQPNGSDIPIPFQRWAPL